METLYRAGLSNALSATVLALVVACLGRILWRRPAVLHCLWLLVLLKLVTPSLYELPIPWIEATSTAHDSVAAAATEFVVMELEPEAESPLANPDDVDPGVEAVSGINLDRRKAGQAVVRPAIDWFRLACLIWFTGTVSTIVLAIGRIRKFQALLGEAQRADSETHEWVDELAASLGMDRSPSVWWVAGKLSPLVWSLSWRPRLVLPRQLWKGLDEHQRATLIIHELAHLRRGDHFLRFFELIVTALYWWHPVVWWARRSLRDVEEQCCDAWVVWALPDAVKSYADTLLETIDFLNPCDLAEPLLASGFGKVHHLRKRLTMIMTGTTPRLLGVWGTLGTLALAVVLLPVNVSLAQKPDEKTAEEKKEIHVVVTSDDITTTSASAVATAGGTDSDDVVTFVSAAEGGGPEQVRVVVKADGSEGSIAASSLDEAVAKLKTQMKELAGKSPQSDRDKAHQKALQRALNELERTAAKIKILSTNSDKLKAEKDVRSLVIRRVEAAKEMSTEKKAEIERAAAKVAELAQALQAKQKELAEAQAKLSKLTGQIYTVTRPVEPGRTFPPQQVIRQELPATVRVRPLELKGRITTKLDGEAGEKRIDALEKKLEKLLEEVASLKKDRAK